MSKIDTILDDAMGASAFQQLHKEEVKQAIENYYKNKIPKKYKEELVQNYNYNCHACCIKQSFCGDKDCYEDVFKMQGYNQAIDDITAQFNSKGE